MLVAPQVWKKRAGLIGADKDAACSYRENWRGCYEWLHCLLSDAETQAVRGLAQALGKRDTA